MANSEQVPEQVELPGMPEADLYDPLIEWLETKWGRHTKCPYCGINEWTVGPPIALGHVHPDGEPTLYYAPEMFTVTCRNCGHVVFINREAADLEPPKPEISGEDAQ